MRCFLSHLILSYLILSDLTQAEEASRASREGSRRMPSALSSPSLTYLCGKCGQGRGEAACAAHGAPDQQCTEWEVHGVAVHLDPCAGLTRDISE